MPTREQYARSKRRRELGLAWCSSCKANKPQSEFNPCPGRRPFNLSSHCLDCDRARKAGQQRSKYWSLSDAGRREQNRKVCLRKFGITVDDYDRMLIEQSGVCAICKSPEVVRHHSTGEIQPLAVDHDHESGQVRGLLCTRCNKGIGLLRHNEAYLRAAADYVARARIETQGEVKLINRAGVAQCSGVVELMSGEDSKVVV